jgi:hypothetical protein
MIRVIVLLACTSLMLTGCTALRNGARATRFLVPTSTPALLPTMSAHPAATATPTNPLPTVTPSGPPEVAPLPIPLAGPAAQRNAEFSGMAWYRDTLILLPQYPDYFTLDGQGVLFGLPKADLLAFLDGAMPGPLQPFEIPFSAAGLADALPGFEGYEAIAFDGERAYLTVEAETWSDSSGYLVAGWMAPDLSSLTVVTSNVAQLPSQSGLGNKSDEALVVTPEGVLTIHEVNGAEFNPAPFVHRFVGDLIPLGTAPFPQIEYRITDATALDDTGHFWAINYFFPGDDELATTSDPIAEQHGRGPTHSIRPQVERLVEFVFDGEQVTQSAEPPIQLQLTLLARNWEGIASLDERGFLLITDQFPETTLAFVARE